MHSSLRRFGLDISRRVNICQRVSRSSDSQTQTTHESLKIALCVLVSAFWLLPIAVCRPTNARCPLPVAHCHPHRLSLHAVPTHVRGSRGSKSPRPSLRATAARSGKGHYFMYTSCVMGLTVVGSRSPYYRAISGEERAPNRSAGAAPLGVRFHAIEAITRWRVRGPHYFPRRGFALGKSLITRAIRASGLFSMT